MKVVGYTNFKNQKSKLRALDKQAETIRKLCVEKGFLLDEIFQGAEVIKQQGADPSFFNMLNEMYAKNISDIVVEGWEVITENKNVQDSLLVFLSSKGITVHTCKGSSDEVGLFLRGQVNRVRINMQKEFTKFDQNFENVKRLNSRKKLRLLMGKCEGRKSYKEAAPETIKEIRRLRRKRLGRKRRTCKEIAKILNGTGYNTLSGKKFTGNNVSVILHRLMAS